jgi:hypothetical protein
MSYEIQPLAITNVDWNTFVSFCQKHLGYSPTRGLDTEGMDVKDPSSYLGCLDFNNTPKKHMQEGSGAFRHFHISFVAALDEGMITDIASETNLRIFAKRGKRKVLTILTGSMDEWYRAVLDCCNENADSELRSLFNNVFEAFQRIGARHVFTSVSRQELQDETFVLWSKS